MMPIAWTSPALTQPHGRQIVLPWSTFAERAQSPRPAASKESLARWAPVEFRGAYRCRANVLRAHAVVLDVDDGSPLDLIEAAFDGVMCIVHSTCGAIPEVPRWRVILPLDHPVNADEYDRVWRWLASAIEAEGAIPDYAARDASRAWAVPAVPPSGFYITKIIEGAFASVNDGLAAIPEPEPLPQPTRVARSEPYDRRVERARRYLATMDPAISGSGGHLQTFRAAVALVRGFALEPDDAMALLVTEYNPRCQPAWTAWDLKHKIRQALQRARVPFGYVADRDRRTA